MQDFKTDIADVWNEVVTPTLLTAWSLTTVLASIAGPFGTYVSLSFIERAAYWGGLITMFIALGLMFRMFWRVVLKSASALVEDVLVLTGLAIVFGPIVANVNLFFWPLTDQLSSWPFASVLTFLIGCCAVSLRHLIQNSDDHAPQPRDRLLVRIGAPADARLGWISSDNHHIKIMLSGGAEVRVLMRLRDAVADIDVEPGICVHRSHWVALSQIGTVEQSEGREIVRLVCGATLPVGPTYRANLVETGVLNA